MMNLIIILLVIKNLISMQLNSVITNKTEKYELSNHSATITNTDKSTFMNSPLLRDKCTTEESKGDQSMSA